jgi:ABC-type Fe3+/spermidine/putrescine transport system ATPase subunit
MIELKNVSTKHALRDLSLSVNTGERIVLCGPSGSGKTTLLRVIAGLEETTVGSVFLHGEQASEGGTQHLSPHQRGIGMVFQDLGLWPHLSVAGNIALALPPNLTKRERRDAVEDILNQCLIGGFGSRRIGSLSGGELNRVALCRALVASPRILLLDEPFSGLDNELKDQLIDGMSERFAGHPATAIMVVHDAFDAMKLQPDRILCLVNGRIVDDISPSNAFEGSSLSDFLQRWMDRVSPLVRCDSNVREG